MSVTIPSLSDVTDILDTDMVMVTQSGGQTYKISGLELNKRNQAVIASSTTLTGAPLKTGNIVRAYFTADITGVNTTTGLVLSYNGTSINVKVPKDGALVNFTAQNMGGSPTVYKYLQAYTTLELLYDGTNFVIIGNPVVLSSSTYLYYADGTHNVNTVTANNMQSVSSNAVYQELKWSKLDINYTATEVGTSLVTIKTNVPDFNEAIILTDYDTLILKKGTSPNSVAASYMHYTPGGGYDLAFDIRMEWATFSLKFRQTIKDPNAGYVTIKEMYYR